MPFPKLKAPKPKRVATYARVYFGKDAIPDSLSAQVDYYSNYICSNLEWEFVAVYIDKVITAPNTKRREGFNRMIANALDIYLLKYKYRD